jgi:hypothetical protein
LAGPGKLAEGDRFAGLNGYAGEENFSAQAAESIRDQVEFAEGDAAADQQQVEVWRGGEDFGEDGVEAIFAVGRGGQNNGVAAGRGCHGGEHGAVGVANLAWAGSIAG